MHTTFHNRRSQGEWFDLTDEERESIKSLPDHASDPSDLPLWVHARWIANEVRKEAANNDGAAFVAVSPRCAVICQVIATALEPGRVVPFQTSKLIEESLTAECSRLLDLMAPEDAVAIRRTIAEFDEK